VELHIFNNFILLKAEEGMERSRESFIDEFTALMPYYLFASI
jgi:hypothetical protein